jgi:WD40 repeat protein
LAISPDGRRLASFGFSWDPDGERQLGHVKLWNVATGEAEGPLERPPDPIRGAAFSPDGGRLAVADDQGSIRVWDVATRRELHCFAGHTVAARCVAFSPDGRLLASGDQGGAVIVRDAATGQSRQVLKGHPEAVITVAFSPDGKRLLSAYPEEGVKVWDWGTGAEVMSLTRPGWCSVAAFDPEGKRVARGRVAAFDPGFAPVQVWELTTGRLRCRSSHRQAHFRWITAIVFSPDGRHVASGGEEGDIKLWEATSGRLLVTLGGYPEEVRGLAFSPDGRKLASCARQESIEVWDVAALLAKVPAAPADRAAAEGHDDE